jgi:tetratricopeptide (TPR) repeat protein
MGRYAEALSLLEHFREHGDLQSVMACIQINEALLAEGNNLTDADTSVPSSFQRDCNSETPRSYSKRFHILICFAHALRERYSHTGHGSDLDAALAQSQAALEACRTELIHCPTVLVIHASILQKNVERTGDYGQLYTAESMCRQALGLCATACRLSAVAYNTLGWIMFRLHDVAGTTAYLDEALNLQRRGLDLNLASHSTEQSMYLRNLAVFTFWRHKTLGDPQDVIDAMLFLEQALELCPIEHVNRVVMIETMIDVLHYKYMLSGQVEDLNKAIDLGRQTMASSSFPRGDRRLSFLTALSSLLSVRYEVALSNDCDLEESVNLRREVLQCVSPSFIYRWQCMFNLANSLRHRFTRKGELRDLEESIELDRHAIDLLPEEHHERPVIFSCLGQALCDRFQETRDAADLDEALVSCRYAIAAMSPSHVNYSDVSHAAISYLCIRFEVCQEVDDLEQAIQLSEDLLKTVPDEHIDKVDTIPYLAKALLLRGAYINAPEDIDRAIREVESYRERLAQWAAAPEISRILSASYLARFRLNQDPRDATYALHITNNLLEAVGPSHYERSQCLVHAAELYSERNTPFCDIAIALKHIAEALLNNCRDVRWKIQGAKTFLDIVKTQYKDIWMTASPSISAQLLDIYISTISLLPRVAFFGLHLHSRLKSLAMGQGITLDGASHALNILLPERALEILEQGRAIFWNHALRLRSPFDHVPDEFRDQLASLARQLDRSNDVLHGTQDSQSIEKEAARRRQQSEEFNSLVDQIRCLPGMERFLLHDEHTNLAKAADRGSVAILVSSALGCHATVVRSADDIISIPLDSITEAWLNDYGRVWRTEVTRARSIVRDNRKMGKSGKSSRYMSTKAEDILERLWTYVVFPVLRKLDLEVCCFPLHKIPATKLNRDSDSRLWDAIDPDSGGVQQAALLIFHFMQQVPTARGARIT